MPNLEIVGTVTVGTSEEAAYAEVMEKLEDLEGTLDGLSTNAITVNKEFEDLGFWAQVKGGDKFDETVILHQRKGVKENFGNLEVSPTYASQTVVEYTPQNNTGELFTRMANSYHELIVEGNANVEHDKASPNFTALGATAYNKTWGGVGTTAVTGRVEDLYHSTIPQDFPNSGANKTCGGFFAARRNAPYSQGHKGTSYSIALEAEMINAPATAEPEGTNEYYGNADNLLGLWDTWTNALHLVGGGRRPINAGIFINGFSQQYTSGGETFTLKNGMYNGIIIGASAMRIRGGVPTGEKDSNDNPIYTSGISHETVGINTASWTPSKHGFYLLKHGYSGRVLKANSAALFESDGAKFLNADGSMPFAISAKGTPYIDLKTGMDTDYYSSGIPIERPTDTTRARVGYLPSTSSLNISSDGAIKLITSRNFADSEAKTLDFTMSNNGFYPSETVNLGSQNYFWENIFARKGAVNVADDEKYRDTTTIERPSTAGDTPTEAENLLTAWGNVKYKIFKFLDTNSKKHIGLSAQDISDAFTAQGLTANSYGLYWANTNGNTTTYGVRYNECLAMECAYLRDQLNSVKARLTALENA